ncbi:MAG: LacI family DNA-binding transcriptional regulator [Alphaproteobacteria bacterium]|nr:LacI family DNA-binding transcriptional regulator [Alphaproteobacteria bacterium]MBU1525517.1 LacI family DNA-binding transcriptional regulator [Alphaproteobacteria bacterium]MBU2350919.1 LacI family DNA-binding transcriptional regulator [Alphaproteobacteria bacterium]MBU2383086.1 LacI family DNA-binding transcriptional regulator [Alphaproteobacteria bacterium]
MSETSRPGGKPATINDVARLAGVSKKTVSRVINNSPSVKEETRKRVEAVISKHGYTPDPQARGLAFRRSFLVGMIYDNPSPNYVVNMQQGVLDGVRGSGLELVVHPCDRASPRFLEDVRSFVVRQKLFGVVMPPSVSEDERVVAILKEADCPYVRIASVSLDEAGSMVVTHDSRGAARAARHLAGLGHRRVAFISGPDSFRSSHERGRGFREGLAEHGVELAADLIRQGAYTFESGVEAARDLLGLRDRPSAIFAGNDEMAIGVMKAARELGLDVPRDLSIVGFDDLPMASRVWPNLTTVRLPIRDMGRMAAEKLTARLRGLDPAVLDQPAVDPQLVERDSAGPPRD